MTQKPKFRNKVNVNRNLRIVTLHDKHGKSFNEIARLLNSESENVISPQACHNIYTNWKDVDFEINDKGEAVILNS